MQWLRLKTWLPQLRAGKIWFPNPLHMNIGFNQSILLLQDNPAVGLNYVLLPSVLGGHKNLHQVVDPSCLQVLEHYCRLQYP